MQEGLVLPGPTGESNHWRTAVRSPVLIIDNASGACNDVEKMAVSLGCKTQRIPESEAQTTLHNVIKRDGIAAVIAPASSAKQILHYRLQMAQSDGALIPLLDSMNDPSRLLMERHVCIDTTAAGGNASLLGDAD